jgi:nicotinate-nucleotide adenylyltransferase
MGGTLESENERRRAGIGLFGGSFDPVHLGHLLVAQAAWEELTLERVVFIPAARSPFKPEAEPAPAAERLRLVRLALAGRAWCDVDDEELRRGGVSFTIETVRRYATRFAGVPLHWVVGADHVASLPQWRCADELSRRVRFLVVPRPSAPEGELPPPFLGVKLRGHPLAISSSEIRSRVREGKCIDLLTGPQVAEAIHKNRLYL